MRALSILCFTTALLIMIGCGLLCLAEAEPAVDALPAASQVSIAAVKEPVPQLFLKKPERVKEKPLYTKADAIALARMAWGECRGVGSLTVNGKTVSGTCQKAAAMWCALNRYDAGFEDSIVEVVAAPLQFVGYAASNPVDEELLELAYDVLERWAAERKGCTDVGRVLPSDHMWFTGDGRHNWFVNKWRSKDYYTWELPDVYASK